MLLSVRINNMRMVMKSRVLIAEPDEDLALTYLEYFERYSEFEANIVLNGKECREQLIEYAPDVLVCEPDLLDDFSSDILDDAKLPVIVLSRFEDTELGTHPAVIEFFVKPILLQRLAACIRDSMSLPKQTATDPSSNA